MQNITLVDRTPVWTNQVNDGANEAFHPVPNLSESTGNSTKPVVSYSSPSKRIETQEKSTSVVSGYVFYNGESIQTISSALVALIMALEIFLWIYLFSSSKLPISHNSFVLAPSRTEQFANTAIEFNL